MSSRKSRAPHTNTKKAVDHGEAVVVGVNRFEVEEEKPIPLQRIDEALESQQIERLRYCAHGVTRSLGGRVCRGWKTPRAQDRT